MTQTKTKISLAVLFITFALMALAHIDKANAQSAGVTSIEPNVEYNQYDVTGDGRADYLYVSAVHDGYNYTVKTSININGKRCYSKKTSGWLKDLDIVTLKNKKAFIHLHLADEDERAIVWKLFQFRGNKLKEKLNIRNIIKKKVDKRTGYIKKVKGNSVIINYIACTFTTGITNMDIKCRWKGSKFKANKTTKAISILNKNTGRYKRNNLTIAKKVNVYKTCKAKRAKFTAHKGQRVNLLQGKIVGGKLCVKIKRRSDGKTGWVKSFKRRYHNRSGIVVLFKQGIYAP